MSAEDRSRTDLISAIYILDSLEKSAGQASGHRHNIFGTCSPRATACKRGLDSHPRLCRLSHRHTDTSREPSTSSLSKPHYTLHSNHRSSLLCLFGAFPNFGTSAPISSSQHCPRHRLTRNNPSNQDMSAIYRSWVLGRTMSQYGISRGKSINAYLPMELLREIFLYSIESNQIKSGQLASVCRYWRSVITTMAHLWSTLRVGTWTETEQVATWLQRAYPKKVIIDPQRDSQDPTEAPMFAAFQNSLTTTGQWHALTICSFPAEDLASQLGIQGANQMNLLKVLHIAAGCMHSPSFAHLLNLVPTGPPLSELRLHSPFASTHFLQPHWLPVLNNLTVLILNGRNIDESFELLPTFTQLQTFEADHLRLPFYEPDTNLPLLYTLRKLQLRACSVQWMAGRQFPFLEECAILLPRY
jgi:hypothetical protein